MSKVEIFENERASKYNEFIEAWIPNYRNFMSQLPDILRNVTRKELLVVGCGTGNEIEHFANAVETWNITGVDPSPEMIAQAKTKFNNHKNIKLIEGVVSDIEHHYTYNAATLLLVLHFLEDNGDKLELLKEIAKRLSSGAPFILLDITGDKKQLKENLSILASLLPRELDPEIAKERLIRLETNINSVSESRISELLETAGFEKPLRFFQSSIYMGWIAHKK